MSSRSTWYRCLFTGILLVPALLCQQVVPLVPAATWESASESVYAALLHWQRPHSGAASKVVVVEVDKKTIDALGWPIDRSYYVRALARLEASGHPWILSLLAFQALSKAKGSSEAKASRQAADATLAKAIARYGRYIGTGLWFDAKADLDDVPGVLARVTLSRSTKAALPSDGLLLAEDPQFVAGEPAFGYGTRFRLEPVVRCMQMYLTDAAQTGRFVIPSGLAWAAAYATESQLVTAAGANWPRPGERAPFAFRQRLHLAYLECLPSPGLTTARYFEVRGIQRLSLADLLAGAALPQLAGKIVVLAPAEMRRYRGPGTAETGDDGVVEEHLLAARFLDALVAGDAIRRGPLATNPVAGWLPLAAAGLLLCASAFLAPEAMVGLALAALVGLLGFSTAQLYSGTYTVHVQTLASLSGSALGLIALCAYLRYYGVRRQVRFAAALREALSQCNTLAEVEKLARELCRTEFGDSSLAFEDFDRELFEAASDANAALALLDRRRRQAAGGDAPTDGERLDSVVTRLNRPRGLARLPFAGNSIEARLAITSKLGRLGTVRVRLTYEQYEEGFVALLLDLLRVELSQHWHRIKLLVDQQLLDYRYLREQTRGEIMARFLTKVLVAKFSDDRTMEENLRTVLNPRPTKAALLQADIRGYSKMSAQLAPAEMVRLLQSYFRNVVDAAQTVAQVKLIGDCIFLFIEPEAAHQGTSPADMALELAAYLASETLDQNRRRQVERGEALNFGIAIHYGEVVVGNLSSDSCIDYTVIGPNVNQVARLEELTKHPEINSVLGTNGIIVSTEAANALVRYASTTLARLDLPALGVSVRSFPQVTEVQGLTATAALGLCPWNSPAKFKQAG